MSGQLNAPGDLLTHARPADPPVVRRHLGEPTEDVVVGRQLGVRFERPDYFGKRRCSSSRLAAGK
jgi:hypothetical protein